MNVCEESERLLKIQQEAFDEWYKRRAELDRLVTLKELSSVEDARRVADEAYKKLRRSMDALLAHYREHACKPESHN